MKTVIRSLWNNEFYQGGIVLTIGSFFVNLMNYFFYVLTAKSLGPNGFGEVSALISYISVISLPVTILSTIIIQKISAAGNTRPQYAVSLEQFFISKVKTILLVSSPLLLLTPFLPRLTNLSLISSYILVPSLFLSFLGSFYGAANQGLRLFFVTTLIMVVAVLLKLTGAGITFLIASGTPIIIVFLLISSLFSFAASYMLFHQKVRHSKETPVTKINKRIISVLFSKQFAMFALSVSSLSAFGTIDIMFVKKFFSADIAGIYSSWSLFAKVILYAIGPLLSLSFIFFSSAETRGKQRNTLILSLIFLVLVGGISYFFYTAYAHLLIELIFGNRFDAVIQYLGKASIFGFLYAAITFINNYFLSQKSNASLILPFSLPFYIIGLFIVPKNINNIIQLTIMFSAGIIGLYLSVFLLKNALFGKAK